MQIFNLQDHMSRFKGKSDYDAFVADFRRSLRQDEALVAVDGNDVLCSILSPEAAKEVLYLRLSRTLASNPAALSDVKASFEDDDVVDVPKPSRRKRKT